MKRSYICIFGIASMLASVLVSESVLAQSPEPQITQEYFIQQAANEALLVRINAFEAEFETRVLGENGEVLLVSAIPGSRIAPVFQYVNAAGKLRQLDIRVNSTIQTGRSEFGIEVTRLEVWDERSNAVARAYQMLSFGLQTGHPDTEANWTVKINNLINASRLFQQFGMKEMRLWSSYLAAHLIHFRLHDYSTVYTLTREILADAKGSRLQKIELASLQLQSMALIGLKRTGSLQVSEIQADPVQSTLSRLAGLAKSMGFLFEQASALDASGTEYASDAAYSQALDQFQRAVEIADAVDEPELATDIRERILAIHAAQGNAPASSEVLQEIETQLAEEGGGDELALNLLAQGRLLIAGYRFGEALEVLLEAMNQHNNSAIGKQISFELARLFYETGRRDAALVYLGQAGVNPDTRPLNRSGSIIDYDQAFQIMAGIYRARGDYERMRNARRAQAQYKPAKAGFLYQQGLDQAVTGRSGRSQAQSLFRQSRQAASEAGVNDLKHLSLLQLCALAGDQDSLCTQTGIKNAVDGVTAGGVPRFDMEARFLWAQILAAKGQRSEAIHVLGQLVERMHFLRHTLASVLGSWYYDRHQQLFEYYLELLADDSKSLLALSKFRAIHKYSGFDLFPDTKPEKTERLRALLAQRAASDSGQVSADLDSRVNEALAVFREPFKNRFEFLTEAGLRSFLQGLDRDEVVLTYHISPSMAKVWVGSRDRVQSREIANGAAIYRALQDAREGLADIGKLSFNKKMDELGKALIDPISDLLTETIYWIPAGPLLGLPVDAIRAKGHYLAEHHTVVNLLSFPLYPDMGSSLQTKSLEKVFLAGHPQEYSGNYAMRLDTSAEIRAIADIFVGPGLNIVQGAALLSDEFQDQRFAGAGLVHLTMPGVIELKYPGQSSLQLSGTEGSPRLTMHTSMDIRAQQTAAELVVLSATRTGDEAAMVFNNQPGLVSDFIDTGAQSVMASFWATSGKSDETFLHDFYTRLEDSGSIAHSLRDAKRKYIRDNRDSGLYDWAAYQLFID